MVLTLIRSSSSLVFRVVKGSLSPRCCIHTTAMAAGSYTTVPRGSLYTTDYRLYYKNSSGAYISPFHDIPIRQGDNGDNPVFNMVVEVPRWTNAKMEIATKDPLNPIKQDVKKDKVRFVHNCFPHHGYIWNYGAIPQTWEDPNEKDESTKCQGDNDPIDVCEIGSRVAQRGDVLQVKVLGCFALIDEGETDWKIIAIDVNDPKAEKVNDINDIETHFPGLLRATHEWFLIYKMPAGNPPNTFAFNGEARNKEFALKTIEETHRRWKDLVHGKTDKKSLSISNTTLGQTKEKLSSEEAEEIVSKSAEPGPVADFDPSVDEWHFVQV